MQHDMNIANQGFPAFRADLNDALGALVSNNSGASAPATTFANMPWYDTTNNIFKIRNEDNDAWISVFTLDQTTDAITAIGSVTLADVVSLTGTQTLTNKTLTNPILTNPTVDKITTGVSGAIIGAGNSSLMKNRIINGAMVIDQRNAGASVTPTVDASYSLDRWQNGLSQSSKYSVQRLSSNINGANGYFRNYLAVTSLANTTVGASDYFNITQLIEGFNFYDLAWGTAQAKTVTLSFVVYSSLTGTFGGSLRNAAANRSYPFSYSIPVANTWTSISITISGDTTGTWVGAVNTTAVGVNFGFGVGSIYSGTAGAWANGNYLSATGATSVVGTSGATFYITGVQLEVGSSATGYEYRQYQQELALCQRYCPVWDTQGGVNQIFGSAYVGNSTSGGVTYTLPVTPRVPPTGSSLSGNTSFTGTSSVSLNSLSFSTAVSNVVFMGWSVSSGVTAGQAGVIISGAGGAKIIFTGCEL